jgi:hypothetical protein
MPLAQFQEEFTGVPFKVDGLEMDDCHWQASHPIATKLLSSHFLHSTIKEQRDSQTAGVLYAKDS